MSEIIDAAQVRASTPWIELIDAVRDALIASDGVSPGRQVHDLGDNNAALLLMPSWIPGSVTGLKTVTFHPNNGELGIPTVNSVYQLFDGATGQGLAVIDGEALTSRRTAAISVLAARYLARENAEKLLVIGTGQMAPNLAHAYAADRDLSEIAIWGRRRDAAALLVEQLQSEGLPASLSHDLNESVTMADIVSCATSATNPLVRGEFVRSGTHVDAVGSFRPEMRETDDAVATRASIFVDTIEGARESGDLRQPIASGLIAEENVCADLAALASGSHPGRESVEETTLFKSAGFALADLAAAQLIIRRQEVVK